jgi:transposase
VIAAENIDAQLPAMSEPQLRQTVQLLMSELRHKTALVDKLTHEMAVLKRLKFAAKSEAFNAEQKSLIEETLDADLAALAAEIEVHRPTLPAPEDKQQPKRQVLPAHLPRREIHHEPEDTTCGCGQPMQRMGQDVAEKLDYQPGVFTVERHIRGKWVCKCCQQRGEGRLVQAPVPAHIIDKGIPTTGLLAQLLVAKYLDHLPLYRQEAVFERAGLAIARSTLAQWVGECGVQLQPLVDALVAEMLKAPVLHADETPVAMLKPANLRDGKTHKAYLWSYCTTGFSALRAVVFDFADSRGGQHVREFLGLPGTEQQPGWKGKLVSDDFSGYKACFELGVTEAGCMAHARRKFHELWANHGSALGEQALKFFGKLYEVEREVQPLAPDERKAIRQERSQPIADALHQWLTQQRQKVPDGSATAKAIDYSLKRWKALTRFVDDGELPIDTDVFDKDLDSSLLAKLVLSWWAAALATQRQAGGSPARRWRAWRVPDRGWPSRCSRAPAPACSHRVATCPQPSVQVASS